MKILVTGAAGFIGFHTSKQLLERGDTVVGLDNFNDYYDVSIKEARAAILADYDAFSMARIDLADRRKMEALFATYPETFRVDVYPSHRDGRYSDLYIEKLKYNALHAELYNGDDGIRGFTGSVAFPIPGSGAEVIWNTRTSGPNYTMAGTYSDIAVFSNGSKAVRRSMISTSSLPKARRSSRCGPRSGPDMSAVPSRRRAARRAGARAAATSRC